MKLVSLTEALLVKRIEGDPNVFIADIQTDSRHVKPNDLFVCIPGYNHDGHHYINEAIRNGASAVLVRNDRHVPAGRLTVVRVPDTERALAVLAGVRHMAAQQQLKLIGVTGTNGKTTTVHLLHHLLTFARRGAGMIGTMGFRFGNVAEKTANTTPGVLDVQRLLHRIAAGGGEYALLEVSSHGLEMGRLRGCDFRTAIFTNLTHDHLDYHETMEQYRNSKQLLFAQLGNGPDAFRKTAVLNADDSASETFARHTSAQTLRYGLYGEADVMASLVRTEPDGIAFHVHTPWGNETIRMRTPGYHNVYNALAAMSGALLEGLPLGLIAEGLEKFPGVRGRMENVRAGQKFRVVVDYAHNPHGLVSVLHALKEMTKGKLICVLGSRGNRDKAKRPLMAQIAASHAETVIVTSDNPGTENPDSIIADMTAGLYAKEMSNYKVIGDREQAIHEALRLAGDDDCVVITGRGHEAELQTPAGIVRMTDAEIVKRTLPAGERESYAQARFN